MSPEKIAEQLYEINRRLSIKLAMNQGLSVEEVATLNSHLGLYIKELRGGLKNEYLGF